MSDALGDVSKSQVDRLYRLGMPRHSVDAARAWRLENLELSRTSDSRIDRPQQSTQTNARNAGESSLAGTAGTAGPARIGPAEPPNLGTQQPASPPDPDEEDPESAPADENTAAYRTDRARNERIKADRAEIELKQLRGELVLVRDVEQLEFTAGRITRDRVLMVPARIAADFHALALSLIPEEHRAAVAANLSTHALERRLDDALRQALNEAAKAIEDARRDDDDTAD